MSSPPSSSANPSPPQQLPPPEPPRKFPAPCWTQEETLALINAYQDKWYSLRRRNLRSTDWDAVAAVVGARCPDQSPPKSSAQCRHKMEKLRKRYRTEKQRALSFPNRIFSSSWIFFELMDAMENGSSVTPGSGLDLSAQKGLSLIKGNLEDRDFQFGKIDEGLKGKSSFNGDLGSSFNDGGDVLGGSSGKKGSLPIKFKFKNHGSSLDFNSNIADDDEEEEEEEEFRIGGNVTGGYDPKGFHAKRLRSRNGKNDLNFNSRVLNGLSKKNGGGGLKRGGMDSVAADMVASIKMLGDGFMKMEKMKMDMAREIEKMRMEMEMKRSEMILESQQLIVNAFIEGLLERKKKVKVKAME
ncbi:hypothetical protein Ancab_032910 [Ancistrocladus abbreviatus]